jgi:hypothetical protein
MGAHELYKAGKRMGALARFRGSQWAVGAIAVFFVRLVQCFLIMWMTGGKKSAWKRASQNPPRLRQTANAKGRRLGKPKPRQIPNPKSELRILYCSHGLK